MQKNEKNYKQEISDDDFFQQEAQTFADQCFRLRRKIELHFEKQGKPLSEEIKTKLWEWCAEHAQEEYGRSGDLDQLEQVMIAFVAEETGKEQTAEVLAEARLITDTHELDYLPSQLATLDNATQACGFKFAKLTHGGRRFVGWPTRDGGHDWQDWKADTDDIIYDHLQKHCRYRTEDGPKPFRLPQEVRKAATNTLPYQMFNPLAQYFEGLKPQLHTDVMSGLLPSLFAIDYERLPNFTKQQVKQYCTDVLLSLLLAIVRRTRTAGAHYDLFPVLVGDQGCGKSVFFERLLPKRDFEGINIAMFSNNLAFTNDQREMWYQCQGYALIEAQEMAGGSRTQNSSFKAFISNSADNIVLKYSNNTIHVPRRFVPVGTTNDVRFIPADPSTDRRVAVIPVLKQDCDDTFQHLNSTMEKYRDQLWAHALYLHKKEKAHLLGEWSKDSRAIRSYLAERSKRRDETLVVFLRKILSGKDSVQINHLKMELVTTYNQRTPSSQKLSALLTREGWEKKRQRVDGQPVWVWKKQKPRHLKVVSDTVAIRKDVDSVFPDTVH